MSIGAAVAPDEVLQTTDGFVTSKLDVFLLYVDLRLQVGYHAAPAFLVVMLNYKRKGFVVVAGRSLEDAGFGRQSVESLKLSRAWRFNGDLRDLWRGAGGRTGKHQ